VSSATGDNLEKAVIGFVETVALRELEAIDPRDVYMGFLLALNEDFDDDLLQDVLRLLTDI
jgi:hypothetical protein